MLSPRWANTKPRGQRQPCQPSNTPERTTQSGARNNSPLPAAAEQASPGMCSCRSKIKIRGTLGLPPFSAFSQRTSCHGHVRPAVAMGYLNRPFPSSFEAPWLSCGHDVYLTVRGEANIVRYVLDLNYSLQARLDEVMRSRYPSCIDFT